MSDTSSDEEIVTFCREDVVRILRDLEVLVVSLDHIEAAARDVGDEEEARYLRDFVEQWRVLEKLANMRAVLSDAFSRTPGDDLMGELERKVHDVSVWTSTETRPPGLGL